MSLYEISFNGTTLNSVFIRFFFMLCALPVCRGRAWTGVCLSRVCFCRETLNATGHRATETPGGSTPTPFAPSILGGLGLLYSDMRNSEAHTHKHTQRITPQLMTSFTKSTSLVRQTQTQPHYASPHLPPHITSQGQPTHP